MASCGPGTYSKQYYNVGNTVVHYYIYITKWVTQHGRQVSKYPDMSHQSIDQM